MPLTINFADGETSKDVVIPIVGDTTDEMDETIKLKLFNATGGAILGSQQSATYTIINDDTVTQVPNIGTLAFAAANYSDFEGNSGTVDKVVAKIQRTGSTKGAVSVQVQLDNGSTATANDYTNKLPLTINFADGETSKDVVIPIVGDLIYEPDETIKLKLFNATGGASLGSQQSATYTIINDDALVVSIAASATKATEAGTTGTFTISRSGGTSAELMVNLAIDDSSTVTSNTGGTFAVDYSLSSGISGTGKNRSVIIPMGMSSVDISLTAIDDTHAEADEILKLNLASGGYKVDSNKNNATVTIAANDTGVINTNDNATGTDYTKMEGSLRQALINANAFAGLDNITFNIPTTDAGYKAGMYTITLASALDSISDDVNITGLGANKLTVSGKDAVRVFNIDRGKTVNIDGLTIAKGKSTVGGGIFNGGTLTVTNSTITGNSAYGSGGGIYNSSGGTLTVTNSTLDSNSAQDNGGGIFNGGTLTVTNSTLSGNSAQSYNGGGIYNSRGTLTVTNSTLDSNSAQYGGGISNYGTVNAKNTIIAKNTASLSDPDFYGTLTSQGYNLIGVYSGTAATGDIFGTSAAPVDPLLRLLADNGGPTYTMALLNETSPAINAGDSASAPDTDQRGTGFARVKKGRIDIGAYESNLTPM